MATPLRLLILEDNPSDAELMLHALREAGYDPIADRVETEQDYLDRLQSVPEIVLSDFSMPQFDAVRALEIIQERHLDIPVIIVSGSIGEEQAVQIMQRGANDYIIKDRMARLGHAVFQALERRRLREAKGLAEQALSEREELSRKVEEAKKREEESNKHAHEMTVAINEALMLGSVRQHELTEAAERLNVQLRQEIAERQKAEEALRASEERYRALFDLDPLAVYSCDASGVIREFNRRAAELWGREPAAGDPSELFCGPLRLFLPDGSLMPHDECPMAEVISGRIKEARDLEVLIERPDGSQITCIVNIRPLKDARGEIIGAINCFYDISERKVFEAEREAHLVNEKALRLEAEAANRSKDLFLATLSHEVRTPLNAIMGWAAILRSGSRTQDEITEGMEVIERNCKAQAQLIEDVLDVSRIVSGKMELHVRSGPLDQVIIDALNIVRPAANAKGIRLESDLKSTAGSVSCDLQRMQQVVWNLLTNAVKFSPAGATVRITLGRAGSNVRMQVSDNGPGITAELLPHVFDRFRQADSSTRRRLGGLGLGLSIVKHLVELHGGTVNVQSQGLGHGATFTVDLPILAVNAAELLKGAVDRAAVADLTPVARLNGLRLLVVDDEPDARRLLLKVFEEAGAAVTVVGSATEALRMVATEHLDVLISDIAMPGHDGHDLIRKIRASGRTAKDLPAIALTAFAHKDDRRRVLLSGFQVHVAKPADPHELTALVASLAGRTG